MSRPFLPPPRGDTVGGGSFAGWWAGAAGRPETRGCGWSAAPGSAARVRRAEARGWGCNLIWKLCGAGWRIEGGVGCWVCP